MAGLKEPIVSISSRLNYAMSIRGMTQKELAEKTKITVSSLSQYMHGSYAPKQDRIYLLANALGVSEEWLMGFDVPMERVKTEIEINRYNDSTKKLLSYYEALTPEKKELVMSLLENLQ